MHKCKEMHGLQVAGCGLRACLTLFINPQYLPHTSKYTLSNLTIYNSLLLLT